MARPTETAVLRVNGRDYSNWKSVTVEHRLNQAFHMFSFTAAEDAKAPARWQDLQVTIGDRCEILLAGHLVMTGYITDRQVAFDADHHGVQLVGVSYTHDVARSSVMTQTGRFDGYTWLAIAQAVVAPFGISVETIGDLQDEPFKNVQVAPGETAFAFLERLARMRGIVLSTTAQGNLLAVGRHAEQAGDSLVEGDNILRARVLLSNKHIHQVHLGISQTSGDDNAWGRKVSQIMQQVRGSANRYSPLIVPVEQPGTESEVRKRVEFERNHREGTRITAEITVQGWLRPGGDLWRFRNYYRVISPMALLDETLGARSAIYTQGPDGTLTVLEMVDPIQMNNFVDLGAANPGAI